MSRRVHLVLCSDTGDVLGALPEFDVSTPWWPDVEPVVAGARERFGVDVSVLRVLTTDADPVAMGGDVTYAAELLGKPSTPPPLASVTPDIERAVGDDHPLRLPWARPGGIAATIAWADAVLAEADRPRTGPAVQVKSWNLSSVVRLPTTRGDVWCKSVPPFLAHEGTIVSMVGAANRGLVPEVVRADPRAATALLGDVAGEDQWEAPEERLIRMVRTFVEVQADWAERVDALIEAGVPDRRADAMTEHAAALIGRSEVREQLDPTELRRADDLLTGLPDRLTRLADCGLPDTLVHGDFHPGNWRFDGDALVLLDWGDSFVGHPMLDHPSFLDRVPDASCARVRAAWLDAWRAQRPSSDPARAAELVAPIAALRAAIVYQSFLDGIEPSERRYHSADVPLWLRRAL